VLRAIIIVIALLLAPPAAQAQKRIALLIGNKDYKAGVGVLVNPLNDLAVVSNALKKIGFEIMKPTQNASRADMLLAVHDFAGRLKAAGPDAVGFLYYSGHGIASQGENYLIPVDVEEPSTLQLSVRGVKHSEVLTILRNEAPNAAHYLVLDACRNNLQGARGGKGFVPVGQQSGVLVAFAAEPGKTASDLGQGSGPYAAALAAELVKPGQNDLLMFHNVRVAVMDKTGGDQVPWTEDGIQRRQRVMFGGEGKPSGPVSQPQTPRSSEAAEAWAAAKDTTNVAVLDAFIARYKDTFYAELARARIEELKKKQVSMATPPSEQPPPPAATGNTQPRLLLQSGDWGAYTGSPGGSKVCFAMAKPTSASPAARAPTFVSVSSRPSENVSNEFSIIAGYVFKPDVEATAQIGSASFSLFTQKEGAWIRDTTQEPRMIEAMRQGNSMLVKGTSSTGAQAAETFSLRGFARALERAEQECK
jgi:uncharacterized caspase-like protein